MNEVTRPYVFENLLRRMKLGSSEGVFAPTKGKI
jgi:hypothetical protein